MAKVEDFSAVVAVLNTETNRISDKLEELIGEIEGAGLDADQEAVVLDSLQALADRLKTIGADPKDPVPVEPAPEA